MKTTARVLATLLLACAPLVFMPKACAQGGVPVWTNRYNGPGNKYDAAYAVVADSGGNVFVTGHSFGRGSDYDYATIKYLEKLTDVVAAGRIVVSRWQDWCKDSSRQGGW